MNNQANDDLQTVMSTPQGRRFMWALILSTGMFDGGFVGNSSAFYRDGRQSVGLDLHRQLKAICPQALRRAEDEYLEYQQALKNAKNNQPEEDD